MTGQKERLYSVDILRGIAMILMALDHTRDYFHDVRFDPLDLTQTTTLLFITRWVTHHCAPVFVFLAGTGAFLSLGRGKTKSDLARFLVSRGLWLIFLELTVIRLAWFFNLDYSDIVGQVIWAIGWSMIFLAGLIYMPRAAMAVIALGMIGLHNFLDGISSDTLGSLSWLWHILHERGPFQISDSVLFRAAYPLIPWIGVMAAGYLFGSVFNKPEQERNKALYILGGSLIFGFIVIRAINIYGDPHPWTVQDSFVKTVLSFIDTHKYPPSLLYLMMTLGPAILVMPLLEKWRGKVGEFFRLFGRVPLFYYVLHLYLIHGLALLAAWWTMDDYSFMFNLFIFFPEGYGFGLPAVYLVWVTVIAILYLPCLWFADLKKRRKDVWLSYL